MLNVLNIKNEGPEMDKVISECMAIIDLYPKFFPHLVGQGFKLKKYLSKTNGGIVLQDGVVITFEKNKSNTKVARKSIARKKKGDMILHQIASNRLIVGATAIVFKEFIKYCKEKHCENIILSVRTENINAKKFYEKNGFELVDCNPEMWHGKKEGYISGSVYKLKLIADKNIETLCT